MLVLTIRELCDQFGPVCTERLAERWEEEQAAMMERLRVSSSFDSPSQGGEARSVFCARAFYGGRSWQGAVR